MPVYEFNVAVILFIFVIVVMYLINAECHFVVFLVNEMLRVWKVKN